MLVSLTFNRGGKEMKDPKVICPFCEENETDEHPEYGPLLCDECAKRLGDRQDKAEHQNRCDW